MEHKEFATMWQPIKTIPFEILDLSSINFSGNSLTVVLCDNNDQEYEFTFEDMIGGLGSYKYTSLHANFEFNEKLGQWLERNSLQGKVYSLFLLSESSYINWVKQQSYNAYGHIYKYFKHYVFVTCDAVIEVIASQEPCVNQTETQG